MIYAECRIQESLALVFYPSREVRHLAGKTRVLKRLEMQERNTGLIDEDPWSPQPPLLSKYSMVEYEGQEIKVLYDRAKLNGIVILRPRLEEWILRAAKESRIEPEDYGLPSDADRFHEMASINVKSFKTMVEELRQRGNKRIKILENFLKST